MTKGTRISVIVFALGILLIGIINTLSLILPVNADDGGQLILYPIDDTYTDEWNDLSNYGAQSYLKVGDSESEWKDYLYHAWLKFNLSSVPEGAVGVTAVLELYECSWSISETHNVSAYLCLDNSWSEYGLREIDEPYYNRTSCLDSTFVHTSETWYLWSVTDAVKNATIVTIVLEESWYHEGAEYVEFNSKETESNIPKLTIIWTAIPEFPSLIILPLFMIATLLAVIVYKRKHQTRNKKREV